MTVPANCWACRRTAWARVLAVLPVDPALKDVLTREQPGPDQLVLVGERLVVLNRVPIRSRGRDIGSVTTLRDRTELSSLERELGATRTATDTLRAQAHEFANQLHVISGLIQIGEYDSVVQFVNGATLDRTRLNDEVTSRIQDPALAALLIAKSSLATERGVTLQLDPESALERVDDELVPGPDHRGGQPRGQRPRRRHRAPRRRLSGSSSRTVPEEVVVTVRDTGPGIAAAATEEIFRQGFTTKKPGPGGRQGLWPGALAGGLPAQRRRACRGQRRRCGLHRATEKGAAETDASERKVAKP